MAYAEIRPKFMTKTGLSGLIERLRTVIAQHRARRAAYRQTHDELSAYSDRELAEIHLRRSDIPTIAQQSADMA